jgi:hypothetical protein
VPDLALQLVERAYEIRRLNGDRGRFSAPTRICGATANRKADMRTADHAPAASGDRAKCASKHCRLRRNAVNLLKQMRQTTTISARPA